MTVRILILLIAFLVLTPVYSIGAVTSKRITIRGLVRDAQTSAPIGYATVYVGGTTHGTITDQDGRFSLQYISPNTEGADSLIVCFVGYRDHAEAIRKNNDNLRIELRPTSYNIGAVEVKAKRQRYSRRGNPAAILASELIKLRDKVNPRNSDYLNYEQYEKVVFATTGIPTAPPPNMNKGQARRYERQMRYADTSQLDGQLILPVTIKEKITQYNYSKAESSTRITPTHTRSVGIDNFISQEAVMSYLSTAFTSINVFDGDIYFMQRHFTGPLSRVAPVYYKYYLRDTVTIDSAKYIDLEFVPHNQQALGFIGHMFVAADSTRFIKRIEMDVPSHINLNFIRNLRIRQEFERGPQGQQLLVSDDAIVETVPLIKGSVQARRYISNRDYDFSKPTALPPLSDQTDQYTDQQWVALRHTPISRPEKQIGLLVNELRSRQIYRSAETLIQILVDGYVETGKQSKFDIGPVLSFLSGNILEGTRFSFGGFTTAKLMPHLFLEGDIGYGTRDKKIKYHGAVEYSFNRKKHYPTEFPIHSLRVESSYDVDHLGRSTDKDSKATVMTWLQRQPDSALTYRRQTQIVYTQEFRNHLSYSVAARYYTEFETPVMRFAQTPWHALNFGTGHGKFSMSEAEFTVRYAPGEELYQTKNRRYRVRKEAPVFLLSHRTAFKGVLGSDFTSNRTDFMFTKRFTFAPFGYIDAELRAAAQWNAVPYILLPMPNVNLSFIIHEGSFALMNPMEFVWDKSCAIDLTYYLDGLLFNRIPLLNRTGLREVISFRAVYGQLSRHNNPTYNTALPALPASSHIMDRGPYMEIGIGIENILKIFRVDYVRRLNYLHLPNVSANGVQITARFKF